MEAAIEPHTRRPCEVTNNREITKPKPLLKRRAISRGVRRHHGHCWRIEFRSIILFGDEAATAR
jgi:hypothetical protein